MSGLAGLKMMAEGAVVRFFGDVDTNILPKDTDIETLLNIIKTVMLYGIGAAAVLGVIIAGIQYMLARDNESQVAAAKKRLFEVVLGLVAWAIMFTATQWVIPGFKEW